MRTFGLVKLSVKAAIWLAVATFLISQAAWAGSVFITGHDPDFHALVGGNAIGARNINTVAINFIRDPGFNAFVTTAPKFLFVESAISVPVGHVRGKDGIVASGYVEGTDFDWATAATLNTALNSLGTSYSALVIASDFGGTLTQAELDILNARSADIISFVNAGGGLYAMAESNNGAQLTPSGGQYGFLPFLVSSVNLDQSETGYTVTPFGASLGLTNVDINGNFSHAVFTSTGGMNIVDVDATGQILSLATRSAITPGGVVPEPTFGLMIGAGLAGLIWTQRRRLSSRPRN